MILREESRLTLIDARNTDMVHLFLL